jgi:hypothetical protein
MANYNIDAALGISAQGLQNGLPYVIPFLIDTAYATATVTGGTGYSGSASSTVTLGLTAGGTANGSAATSLALTLTSAGAVNKIIGATSTTATLALTSAGTLGATTTATSLALSLTAAGVEGDVAGTNGTLVTLANTAAGTLGLVLGDTGTTVSMGLSADGFVYVLGTVQLTPAPIRPANPKVGPMALRNLWQRRPQSVPQNDGFIGKDLTVAPTFDAVGAGSGAVGISRTWNHVIATDANFLVVFSTVNDTTSGATCTVGSTPMIQLSDVLYTFDGTNNYYAITWVLPNPPTGSQTITLNTGVSRVVAANSLSYKNVLTYGPITNATTYPSGATNMSQAVTVPPNQMAVGAFFGYTGVLSGFYPTQRSAIQWVTGQNVAIIMGDAPAGTTAFEARDVSAFAYGAATLNLLPTPGTQINIGLTAGGAVTGDASTAVALGLTANGAQDYSPRVWPQYPNANVGPMALREAWRPRPKSVPQKDGFIGGTDGPPVQFGAVGAGSTGLNTVHSWTHVVASDDNFLVVIIGHDGGASPTFSGTVGTKAMDFLGTGYHGFDGTNYYYAAMLVCPNPPTGSQTVTITGTNSYAAMNSVSYKNVNVSGNFNTFTGPGATNKFMAITSLPGQMVVGGMQGYTGALSGFYPNQRYVFNYVSGIAVSMIMGDALGGTATAFQAESTAAEGQGWVTLNLIPTPSLPLAFTLTAGGNLTRDVTPIAITATLTSAGTLAVTSTPDSITIVLSAAGRLSVNTNDPGVTVTTTGDGQLSVIGAKPVIIPNPNVGPMALRNTWHWRPKSQFNRDGWLGSSTSLPASVNPTGGGATNTVTFDAVGTGDAAYIGTRNLSWTHNIQGNLLLVAWQGHWGNVTYTATASVGATNIPLYAGQLTYLNAGVQAAGINLFALLNPPQGVQTITVSVTSPTGYPAVVANSISYNNVGALGSATFSNTGVTTLTNVSTGATATSPRQMVFNFFGAWDQTASNAITNYGGTGGLITQRSNQPETSGDGCLVIGDGVDGSSLTFSCTLPTTNVYGAYTVPLFPLTQANTTVSFSFTADGLVGAVGIANTTVSLALTSIGVVTAPAAQPVRIPNPFVGPMALRQRRRPRIPPYPIRLDGYTVNDAGVALSVGLTAGGAASGDAATPLALGLTGYGYSAVYSPVDPSALTVTTTAGGILGLQAGAPTTLALTLTSDAVEGLYVGASNTVTLGLTSVGSVGILQTSLATTLAATPTAAGGGSGNAATAVSLNLLASGGGAGGGSTTVTWNSIAFGRRGIFADASLTVTASRTANTKFDAKIAATQAVTASRTPVLTRGGLIAASLAVTATRTIATLRRAYADAPLAVTAAFLPRFRQNWLADAELSVTISEVFPYEFPFVFERGTTTLVQSQKFNTALAVTASRPSVVGFPRTGSATLPVTATRSGTGTRSAVVNASRAITLTTSGAVRFGAKGQAQLAVTTAPNSGVRASYQIGASVTASVTRASNARMATVLDADLVATTDYPVTLGQAQRIDASRAVTTTLSSRLKLSAYADTNTPVAVTIDALTPGAGSNLLVYYLT